MTRKTAVGPTGAGSETDGFPWRYLVVLPAAELPVAGLAMASSYTLGPSHAATGALGVFLTYATPVVGVLSFAGLVLDGRRKRTPALWYAGSALTVAVVLSYHGTGDDAFFGLWEPGVALALAMVPVGSAYVLRHHLPADRGL
ncbi:hypothetical protein NGM10_03655 [Halorussus salilacus]|uniref:hypothetical protein n=1 Tax=Halorussus salilacus TaxID=2953750 RepID=UPI00209D9423|nr:hypothetical protein [Halorussus salilacus]USZ68837.1 hypothetical protein NGM10_03655 [Halorussus salilacus]